MAKGTFLFLLILGGIWFWFSRPLGSLADVPLSRYNSMDIPSDCSPANERCIVVYVSPWCPACRRAKSVINELYAYVLGSQGTVGMKVVVGRDEIDKLENFAKDFHPAVYLDQEGDFYQKAKVGGVPCWFVIDGERNIQTVFRGVLTGPKQLVIDAMIDEQLQLSEYL